MALAQYGTLITTIGLAQIANAQITQSKVGLEYIALGDGNGAHYVPTQNQTALVHEVWRGPIAELSIDPTNSNRIIIDAVIPVTAGGFTIREIGIFDDKNQLIAIGQYPEKYKPQLSEGVSEETLIHFVIETNNADVVKLNIDPTVIIASRKYVDAKVADAVGNIGTDLTELKTEVTTHLDESVVSELGAHKLRYFNDNLEVNIGSVWNKIKTGVEIQDYLTGHISDLKETGLYYSKGASGDRGFPMNDPTVDVFIEVWSVDEICTQTLIFYDGSTLKAVNHRAFKNNAFGSWSLLPTIMTNSLNSTSSYEAVSAYALKMVNDAKADKVHGSSITPTGKNGWNTSSATYFKDSFGIVHVNLYAMSGTTSTGTIITTLPVDYRPASNRWFSVTAYNGSFVTKSCALIVRTSGDIVLDTSGDIYINGYLSFPTV